MRKDTIFEQKQTINAGGKLIDLSSPIVMGILNLTPDSFYDGGINKNENVLLDNVEKMLSDGAAIIDIGAYSSKPGASHVSQDEELNRLLPVLRLLNKSFPDVLFSIDTFRSEVASIAIQEGASMINDISGGEMDDKMFEVIAQLKIPYILIHMQGTPQTMQLNPTYENVVTEIAQYFSQKVNKLKELGCNDIILDPGFGFGKTLQHNYTLLKYLSHFKMFGLPLLAGVSRKSMIGKVIDTNPVNSLNGTTVCNTIALLNGAKILRVHDVKEAIEAVKIVNFMQHSKL